MSTKKPSLALKHKAAFRQRRKAGLVAVVKPWDWLSVFEVKALAVKAYRVASFDLAQDVQDPQVCWLDAQEFRQAFACNLAELFTDLLMAQAVSRGGCWPITPETPPYRDYPQIAAALCAELPASWKPQYPLYAPAPLPVGGIGGAAPDVAAKRRNGIEVLAC